MTKGVDTHHIWVGDFNMIGDPKIDKAKVSEMGEIINGIRESHDLIREKVYKEWDCTMGAIDIWRMLYPTQIAYTHENISKMISNKFESGTRLYYAMATPHIAQAHTMAGIRCNIKRGVQYWIINFVASLLM